nr:9K [Cardamom mosaic virus]
MEGKLTRESMIESLQLEDIPNASLKDAILLGNRRSILALSFLACGAFAGLAWYLTWDDNEGLNNKWNKKQRVAVHKEVLE